MSIAKLKTKFVGGTWIKDMKHFFSKTNEIIDYINNNPVVSKGYIELNALISQTGTSAPEYDDITNSYAGAAFIDEIGGSFTYVGAGNYRYVKAGAFTDISKVSVELGRPLDQNFTLPGLATKVDVLDANTLRIQSGEYSGFSGAVTVNNANDLLVMVPFKIKIYS